jgi:phosphatidylglycerol---prolipoprotein diacylglyceryl transferase
MNPVVYKLGPLEIRAFTAWIATGVVIGIGIILSVAMRRQQRLMPWFDAATNAVVGGVIGARAFHVWLNWSYFSAHTDQIIAFQSGGLDWHGAVIGGLLGATLVGLASRIPLSLLMDGFALALPVGAMATWIGCGAANCGYGVEVPTLADYPAWLVSESPDVYGTIAPRLNLSVLGIVLAVLVLAVVLALVAFERFGGARLWLALALYSLGMALISFFRAEYVPTWFGRRADQVLDLVVALGAILLFGIVASIQQRRTALALARSPVA